MVKSVADLCKNEARFRYSFYCSSTRKTFERLEGKYFDEKCELASTTTKA